MISELRSLVFKVIIETCLLIAAILLSVFVCVLSGTPCFIHYGFIFYFFRSLLAVLNCSSTWILYSVLSVGLVCWIFVVLKVFLSPLVTTEKFFWVYYSRLTIIIAFKDFKCIVRFSSDLESFHWEISINSEGFSFICSFSFFSCSFRYTLFVLCTWCSNYHILWLFSFLALLFMCDSVSVMCVCFIWRSSFLCFCWRSGLCFRLGISLSSLCM